MIKLVSNGDWLSASALLPVLFDVALKSVLVLLLALVVAGCLRKRSAAARHLVWFLAVVSLLFLPVLSLTLPAWHVLPHYFNTLPNPPANETQDAARKSDALILSPPPAQDSEVRIPFQRPPAEDLERIPASQIGTAPSPVQFQPQPRLAEPTPAASAPSVPARSAFSKHWVWMIWLLGAAIALLPVGIGMFSLWRLSRSSRQETEPSWLDLLQSLKATLRVRRPVKLLKSNQRRMPMTWGVLRTKLLLPKESNQWSEVRRRVVLLHELAHVKRWDYHTNLFTQIVRAVYWFNPLVWFAARRMVAERERACDDIVLRHGAKPADYAEQILQIASGLRLEGFSAFGGIPMARPSKLEGRLRAILDSTRNRAAMTRMMVIGVTAVFASIVIPVAMMHGAPGEQSQAPAKTDVVKVATNSPSALSTNTSQKVRIEPSDPRINEDFSQIQKEMTNEWHVGGSVVDDETGTSLANFIVQQGSTNFPNPGATNWQDYTQGGPQYLPSGRWGGTFTYWYRSLRILSPGYIPQIFTKESLLDNPSTEIEVRMKRGALVQGVVQDASAHPVPGAQVFMATARRIYLQDGDFLQYAKFFGDSTITDNSGRFSLRSEGASQQKLVVLSADGKFVWPALASPSNENVMITLPRAGTLAVRYDIPGDLPTAKAELWLITTNNNPALWTDVGIGLSCTVTNGGQIVLTNLTPGTYHYYRLKTVGWQSAQTEGGTVEVAAGGISHLDLIRTNGQRLRGHVLGLDQTKTNGGYILVRVPEASGQPWPQRSRLEQKEYQLRTYDIVMFQPDGSFETSMLKPGTYSVIAQVHPPEGANQGFAHLYRNSNPDFVGATKVTIGAATPPEVTIQLAPAIYTDIVGSVVDDENDFPLTKFIWQTGTVVGDNTNDIHWQSGYSGPGDSGTFDFWNTKSNDAFRILANGYVPAVIIRRQVLAERKTADLQVRLKRGGELDGVVQDYSGQPAPSALVVSAPLIDGEMPQTLSVFFWRGFGEGYTFTRTDDAGRFSVRGVSGTNSRLLAISTDRGIAQPILISNALQNVKITLPEPASLIVDYDIPYDQAQASFTLELRSNEMEMPLWRDIKLDRYIDVPNGGRVVLTNLTPGIYDFARPRTGGTTNWGYAFLYGEPWKSVASDRQRLVLEPGKTQHISIVRTGDRRIQGKVVGLDAIGAGTTGALTNSVSQGANALRNPPYVFLYVCAETTADHPLNFATNPPTFFDAMKLGKDGQFQTAVLAPGNYTLVTEVYELNADSRRQYADDEPQYSGMLEFAEQKLAYVGSANVTVPSNADPQPVTIELHPWKTAATETSPSNVLPKNAIIGHVIDVETGQPIPEFAVTPGSGLAPDMLLWRPEETVKGTNGAFSVAKTEPERLDYFKIEVPGYMQEMVSERTLLTNNTVKLHRGEFITGRILDAEGHPVAGAQVALNLVNTIVRLSGTNLGPSPWEQPKWQRSPITTTDSRGEFWLPAGPGRIGLIAVGKDGFAFVKLDHFESSKEIQLEPWVKITGTLSSAGQSLKGKSVQINAGGAFAGLWMSFYTNLVTDSGGHFSYDQVPPGAAQLSFARPGLDVSRRLSNAPGSTVNLQLSLPPEPWTNRRPGIDDQIVWGPETNGLQSGISLAERSQPRKAGEIITVNLWLRNRSSGTIYGTNYYLSDLELQGGKEIHVPATGPWPYLVDEQNSDRSRVKVEPGAELRLKTTTVQIPNLASGTYKLSNLSTHHRGLESPAVTVNGGELLIEIASNSPAEQRSTETARSHPSQTIADSITGHVVDAETGLPIPDFRITPGSGWAAPDILPWRTEETARGTNGIFRVPMPQPDRLDYYKIEMPGYMPEMVSERALLTNNIVKLHRGEFITGRVLDVNGRPVTGAQVALHLIRTEIRLMGTNLYSYTSMLSNFQSSPITTTDTRGEFKLRAGPGRNGLIAASAEGFAFAKLDRDEILKEIRLEPWVKVAGTLVSGGQPLKGKTVRVMAGDYAIGRLGLWFFDTNLVTDLSGHFSYDRVPPSDGEIAFTGPGVYVSHRVSGTAGAAFTVEMSVPSEPWTNRSPEIADQIVWGPVTNGVQSGISLAERPQPRKAGETITVNLWLRNKSSETIYRTNYDASAPAIFAGDEALVPWKIPWSHLVDEQNPDISRVKVDPGAELQLKTVTLQIPTLPAGTYKLQNLSYYRYLAPNVIQVISGDIPLQIAIGSATNQPASSRDP